MTMPLNRMRRLFYNNGRLSLEIGSDCAATVFSTSNTPLAQRSTEARLLAADSQSSIVNQFCREGTHNLAYPPYGYSLAVHMMGFTGQRYDSVTNCYLLGNGYRAFSPTLARFYSPDSLSPFTKHTHNAYVYCLGDPVNHHDPSGHMLKRTSTMWNNIKGIFEKPRIHYIDKARDALSKSPSFQMYSAIIDRPDVTTDTLKAIYRLPKLEAMYSSLQDTAVRNWRLKHDNLEGPITQDFNHSKHLDIEDEMIYIGLKAKINKYRTLLDNLAPNQSATLNARSSLPPMQTESSSPVTSRSAIRGS